MLELFRSLFAPPRHLILPVAALWLGLYLTEKRVERYAVSKDALNNLVYYSLIGYLLGGRLFFAMENLSAFSQTPLSIFSINIDLFDPLAAALTAILGGASPAAVREVEGEGVAESGMEIYPICPGLRLNVWISPP